MMHCKIHLNNNVSLFKFSFIELSKYVCNQMTMKQQRVTFISQDRKAREKYKLHMPFTQSGKESLQTKDTLIVSYLY